jgi:hypothetical protein
MCQLQQYQPAAQAGNATAQADKAADQSQAMQSLLAMLVDAHHQVCLVLTAVATADADASALKTLVQLLASS